MNRILHNALCILLSGSLTLLGSGCKRMSNSATTSETVETLVEGYSAEDLSFTGLNDDQLLQFIEDDLLADLEDGFASDQYEVTDVSALYVSKEYLDELEYNSKANIFFGYTLEEIESEIGGQRYVFTVGDDGHTTVTAFEGYSDPMAPVLKNLAVGGGVILICVTVSVLTAGAGTAGAVGVVHTLFAASAETAAKVAVSTGAMSALTSAVVTGYETGDMTAALEAAVVSGSEGFKIGAITGAVAGGAGKALEIHRASKVVPNWRESEAEALKRYGGVEQATYLDGKEVPSNTLGCSKPDLTRPIGNHLEAIEVKNYDMNSAKGYYQMRRELIRQVSERQTNMPAGTSQRVVMDIRNRRYSKQFLNSVMKDLSNHLTPIDEDIIIEFMR